MNNRRHFFDTHAAAWDTYAPAGFIKRVEREIVPLFNIKKSERVLDVGSGTGILLPFLKKAVGKKGAVVALDFSGLMLRKAAEKHGQEFTYVRANAHAMPFSRDSFDTIVCFSVFPHFVNKTKALQECVRVLKPGGRIVIAHADSRETINNHHRKVGTIVARDHIPCRKAMMHMMLKAGICKIFIDEGKQYYIASGARDTMTIK